MLLPPAAGSTHGSALEIQTGVRAPIGDAIEQARALGSLPRLVGQISADFLARS
jgi:hypothetical protein